MRPFKRLAATIKAHRICEQTHRRMKEELGVDHFERRLCVGLHRHALMAKMAYTSLRSRCFTVVRPRKKDRLSTTIER
jgi:hypothetical protein